MPKNLRRTLRHSARMPALLHVTNCVCSHRNTCARAAASVTQCFAGLAACAILQPQFTPTYNLQDMPASHAPVFRPHVQSAGHRRCFRVPPTTHSTRFILLQHANARLRPCPASEYVCPATMAAPKYRLCRLFSHVSCSLLECIVKNAYSYMSEGFADVGSSRCFT